MSVNIARSGVDTEVLVKDVPWSMLVNFCETEHLEKHLSVQPDGSNCLTFSDMSYEQNGLETVLTWMAQAYIQQSQNILPSNLCNGEYSTSSLMIGYICCLERALAVFGLHLERKAIRNYLDQCFASTVFPIKHLDHALKILPPGSEWVERLFEHIRERLSPKSPPGAGRDHCACGWKVQPDKTTHNECIHGWVNLNPDLQKALGCGRIIEVGKSKKSPIHAWLMNVQQPQQTYPHGKFPCSKILIGTLRCSIPVYQKPGSKDGRYELEWSDEKGGYIETNPNNSAKRFRVPSITDTTEVSRLWLASRNMG